MSKINGDKSRSHVTRKQNIRRRAKSRALLASLMGNAGAVAKKSAKVVKT